MPKTLTTGAGRAFIAGWHVMVLILTACYTCKLTSLLVDVTSPPPFTSVADMVTRGDFRWGILGGTKLLTSLRESTNNVEREVYRGLTTFANDDPDVLSLDPDVHLTKVLSGNYAFVGEGATLERWARDHCEISVLPQRFTGVEHYTVFSQKGSALTPQIDRVLLRLHDTGVLSYLRSRWFSSVTGCHGHRSSPSAISLATMLGPFYIAVGGLIMAAGAVSIERAMKKRRRS